jgi:hypothetical protein
MRESPAPAPIYHPWRVLGRHWPHVEVEHTDELPPGRRADTNGIDEIRMRRRLLQVERRCSLTHELIHLEHGHTGRCAPAHEAEVDREAARRLIPWPRLLAAVRWARSEEELADELWVTVRVLRARVAALHADELMQIARAAHDVHHSLPWSETH